jgi:Na+/melibiose symporter-like transporter
VRRRLWALIARNRDYRLLLSAGLVSLTGDAILTVGLTFSVYVLTGSTLASGLTLLASLLPQLTLGSIAGVFVDRWDRRRTMITTNVLLAVGLMPLLFVHDTSRIWIIYVVVLWESAIAQLFEPAAASLMPVLVTDDELVAANALGSQNRDIARLVGSALGGVVAAFGGIALLAVVDATTFVVAAALLLRIRHRGGAAITLAADNPTRIRDLGRQWADGLRITTSTSTLRTVLWCLVISGVGEGVFGTLIAPWVHDVLHRDGEAYGLVLSVQAIGGIVGGLATAAIGHRFSAYKLMGWGAVGFGAIDVALFAYPLVGAAVWPAFVLVIAVGTPGAVWNAGLMTLIQRHTVDASRGRVMGAMFAVTGAGMLCGVALAATLPHWLGIVPVLAVAQGGGSLAAGALTLARSAEPATKPVTVATTAT